MNKDMWDLLLYCFKGNLVHDLSMESFAIVWVLDCRFICLCTFQTDIAH